MGDWTRHPYVTLPGELCDTDPTPEIEWLRAHLDRLPTARKRPPGRWWPLGPLLVAGSALALGSLAHHQHPADGVARDGAWAHISPASLLPARGGLCSPRGPAFGNPELGGGSGLARDVGGGPPPLRLVPRGS